jgi:septal ring factor EnvC (AmiA/AmiB activator)
VGHGARAGRLWRAAAVAFACVAIGASAAPARKPAPSDAELRGLRERIEKLQKDLAAAEESRGEAAEQLKASGKAVSEARRALFELAAERRAIEAQIAAIAAQDREIRASIARQEELAGRLLRLQYQQGAPDRLRLALEGKDPSTIARHLQYYGYIQRARGEVIEALRAKGEQLAELARETQQHRLELAQNEAAQAQETRRLERERGERAALVKRLAGDIARSRREIGRLKKDEARLTRLVEEIARALAAKPAPKSPAPGKRVEQVPDASSSSKSFTSLKGRLRLPVRGELTGRFGMPREEPGTTW